MLFSRCSDGPGHQDSAVPLFPVVLMVMLLAMDGIMLERSSALAVMMDEMAGLHGGFLHHGVTPRCFSNLFFCLCKIVRILDSERSRRIEDVT